jgi:hypothetical protein
VSGQPPLVYVGRAACGCRIGAIPAAAPSIAGVAAFLKHGGSINTLEQPDADRLPTSCDTCQPVRQERLL